MDQQTFNRAVGLFLIRVVLGLIFLMQGYGKVFSWGIDNVYANAFASYEGKLPVFILWITAYFTSYAELTGGLLLTIGLLRYRAAYLLGIVLVIVTFGHGLSQPIWDLQHVFPRTILLAAFLLLPASWDKWHFDKK